MVSRVAFATLKVGTLGCMTMYPMNTAMPEAITAMHIKVQIMAKHQIKGWVLFISAYSGFRENNEQKRFIMSRDCQHSARASMVFTKIEVVNFWLGKVRI